MPSPEPPIHVPARKYLAGIFPWQPICATALAAMCLALAGAAQAQSTPAATGSGTAALEPLGTRATATAQPAPPRPVEATAESQTPTGAEGCRILTDRAMATDLRAANAQAQRADAAALSKLLDESIGLWTLATERCDDRARERARRNLADSQRSRQSLVDAMGDGAECARGQKNANSLQDLAQQAIRERRWMDAAILYRKAETSWDVLTDKCQGEARRLAQERREQTLIDAHNAEFCAPLFERARQSSQALRRQGTGPSASDAHTLSQVTETLWRDAQATCKGPALDLARQNAQAIAKERGTAWVPTRTGPAPALAAAPGPIAPSAPPDDAARAGTPLLSGPAGQVVGSAAAATGAGLLPAPGAASAPVATTAPTTPPAPAVAQDMDIQAGGQRYTGQFVRDGSRLTGRGRIVFANGDVYSGDLVDSQRHGQGEFIWTNGQRYQGTWVKDVAQGQGKLVFANGNTYEGDVQQGLPQGQGQMTFASGDTFRGRFVAGKPEGSGTYRWANGQTYEGPWTQDQPNGDGTLTYANGNRYVGRLVQGIPEGQGTLTHASGDTYQGQFVQGLPDGEGQYRWSSGDRYSGQWKAGKKHGQGVFEWRNGDRWEGLFDDDDQTEKGTLTQKPS